MASPHSHSLVEFFIKLCAACYKSYMFHALPPFRGLLLNISGTSSDMCMAYHELYLASGRGVVRVEPAL